MIRLTSIFSKVARRLKVEGRDLIEFFLVPGIAALLPWSLCFRLYKLIAKHWTWLYREHCFEGLNRATTFGCAGTDEKKWMMECRLVTLMDHADHYLYRTRTLRAMSRYIDVHGCWEGGGQAAFLWTFHWGMGMWALRHARAHGLKASMILAAPSGPDFIGRTVFAYYVRARMRSVELALREPVIFVPGGMSGLRAALDSKKQVVVVMDVPQDQVSVTRLTTLLGSPVSVPAVLPQIAVDKALPVTVFYMGLDVETGRRQLYIHPLGVHHDVKTLTDATFLHLDRLLKDSPAAWHFWPQASRFFVARD